MLLENRCFRSASDIHYAIENIVDNIMAIKKNDAAADVSALEAEIDRLVYRLYDLTLDEIRLVEGKTK